MKIKNYVFLIIISVLLFCSTSCNFKKAEKVPEENVENIGTQANTSRARNDVGNIEFGFPDKSGPVTSLPWENDLKFIEAQKKNETDVLLAAYVTVLRDPLPGEEYNVHLAASSLAGTVVQPGHIFSQNSSIGPYVESRGYKKGPTYVGSRVTTTTGGGVCKIASTLYNVSILSNIAIVERHSHGMPVPYVPYGQDATVAYGVKDFKFKNNKDFPILIWAKGVENNLYIAFYGREKPPKIKWQHKVLATTKAPREYRINPDLEEGVEKVIIKGMDGARVDSCVIIEHPDGTTEKKNLGISYYRPMPYLIEVKSRP
ncbi:MAG: VanW family protein [Natronincolaceae bacterium]|nr:VanW family protein [Bacillota bacterium]NLK90651.1 VanW family protein [Clostridiales bacterium]